MKNHKAAEAARDAARNTVEDADADDQEPAQGPQQTDDAATSNVKAGKQKDPDIYGYEDRTPSPEY